MRKILLLGGIICIVLIVLDQWLKLYAIAHLQGTAPRTLVDSFIRLTYLENRGVAFGFMANLSGAQWLLAILKIVLISALLCYYFWLPRKSRMWVVRVPVLFIIAGGIGNLIDRIRLGFVVDMLEFTFVRFPVFNLADVFVTAGVFTLVFVMLVVVKDVPFPG